jgi:YesN/AraC family two-component response regulator
MKVHEASDGRVGMARYRQKPSDVVIMDMLMPEVDGLIRELRHH